MSTDVVTRHIELTQAARESQTDEAWAAAAALWAEDITLRVASGRSEPELWRTTAQGRAEVIARLSRPAVSGLTTQTVRIFGSAALVCVEQVSRLGDTEIPTCFVFELTDGLIARISVYRNEAT